MNANPNLRVRISADLADIRQGLALLRGEVAKVRDDASTMMRSASQSLNKDIARIKSTIGGLLAGVSAGALVRGIVGETGQSQDALAQLRASLRSTGEAAGLTESDLVGMAEGMALATTHSTDQIIAAQTALLTYSGIAGTEFPRALQLAIDQSIRLGQDVTASAEAVGRALEYPSQGVASLTRQGFRFSESQKAVLKDLERTGRLAEAQAIVMDVMEESYRGAAEAARNTLPGALQALGNAMRELLDGNGGRGASQLTAAINDLVDLLRSPETKAAFGELADDVLRTVGAFARWMAQDGIGYVQRLIQVVAFLVRNIDTLILFVGARLLAAGLLSLPALIARFAALRASILATELSAKGLRAVLATMGGPVTLAIAALTAGIYYLYQRTGQAEGAANKHADALERVAQMARWSTEEAQKEAIALRKVAQDRLIAARAELAVLEARQGRSGSRTDRRADRSRVEVAELERQIDDFNKALVEIALQIDDDVKRWGLPGSVADEMDGAGKRIAGSNALLRDSIARSLAEIERLYADHDIGITEYFERRQELQLQAVDAEIEQARMQLAAADKAEQRGRLEEQITILQRNRAEIAATTARDQAKAEEGLAEALADVRRQLDELDGNTAAAVYAQLNAQYEELLKRLQAAGDAAGEATVNSLISRLVAASQSDELNNAVERIRSKLTGTEQSVSAQVSAGMMGYGEGERQLAEARARALADLRDLRDAARQSLANLAEGSPGQVAALKGLQQIDIQIAGVVSSMNVWQQRTEDLAANSLGDALADLATGARNFKDAFSDMVSSFVQGVARMVSQELALRAVRSMFSGFGGVRVGVAHSGGVAGALTNFRNDVSPMLFGAAPRYHGGGIAGLASDEIPAILQRGEVIRTRQQESALQQRLDGRAGSGLEVEINNYGSSKVDPRVETAKGPDGSDLKRLVIDVWADDFLAGGKSAMAVKSRLDVKDRV